MSKVYIETYGCQMNVADSEVVSAILLKQNYNLTHIPADADLILVNTCSIRDHAEIKVKSRIRALGSIKKSNGQRIIGVIGCMAERLKEEILQELPEVSLIAGPDSYRDLPRLLSIASQNEPGINTQLSLEETYAEISPVRLDENNVTAFISIMRGCNNFCSYCVVPYTRGRERSRDPETILNEIANLIEKGYKEVTLLGQNVNSYHFLAQRNQEINFPGLLKKIAVHYPDLRLRFATSHPKDMSDDLLRIMADHSRICKHIHLPVQSGSSSVLKRMNRKYTSSDYFKKIDAIRKFIPEASISTDIITGFPGETETDHQLTLSLMKQIAYDFAYMFKYSERPGTLAQKKFKDDIPEETKTRRLNEIISLQSELSLISKKKDIGKEFEVLAEGTSKKSDAHLFGRTSQNKVVVFPKRYHLPGDYVKLRVKDCTSATLMGYEDD
ncbi:MAG: tRNA (N6-isopentenyl adenosine(37)-C2)-methylthiotransferase MiaB [Bacteroidota bacterium]